MLFRKLPSENSRLRDLSREEKAVQYPDISAKVFMRK